MWITLLAVAVGTFCINRAELYSRTQSTFGEYLLCALPFLMLGQFCLYSIFNRASNIMTAWITWTVTMSILRVVNSQIVLHEDLDLRWTVAGVLFMLGASLCMKQA
jgi:uncharacterized membrane protein